MEKIEIKVTKTTTSIVNGYVLNQGEYQVDKCKFDFSDEYADLVKKAVFVSGENEIDMVILDDECDIPYEILQTSTEFTLKVYGYKVENEELALRYSPTALKLFLREGSYVGSKEVITPTQFEQYEQALNDGLAEVANVDIDASKSGNTTTVTITDRTGTEKSVEIYDGEQGIQGPEGPAGQDGADGRDATINGVNTLTIEAGENINISQSGSTLTISGQAGGTADYTELTNKPSINNVELSGNKTTSDLGIVIPDVSNFITKDVNNLTYYELKTATGNSIAMSIDSSTYVLTVSLKNSAGTVLNTQTVDLPLETMVVGGSYDSTNKKIILTLKNGQTVEFSVADLVSGLQSEITSSNKLSADLVDDTSTTNKFTNATEKSTWNGKYDKPSGGIPSTDLAETYVKPTDYATTTTGGVIIVDGYYGTGIDANGKLKGATKTYAQYQSGDNHALIEKATLENVITGKGLLDSSKVKNANSTTAGDVYDVRYINTLIGDIDSALDSINGESVGA